MELVTREEKMRKKFIEHGREIKQDLKDFCEGDRRCEYEISFD